jgi:hypothetical protein
MQTERRESSKEDDTNGNGVAFFTIAPAMPRSHVVVMVLQANTPRQVNGALFSADQIMNDTAQRHRRHSLSQKAFVVTEGVC